MRCDGGAPGGEELGGDGVLPELGPGFEGSGGAGVALGEVVEGGVGGVAEGAEHAGDVAEGRLLGAALGERAGGLAFEVEDDVVAAGAEELAEVVVAVDADALAGASAGGISVTAWARLKSWMRRERMRAAESVVSSSGRVLKARLRASRVRAIWARMRAASAARGSAVKGSGVKAGLSVGVARARCISAVRRPRRAAASR